MHTPSAALNARGARWRNPDWILQGFMSAYRAVDQRLRAGFEPRCGAGDARVAEIEGLGPPGAEQYLDAAAERRPCLRRQIGRRISLLGFPHGADHPLVRCGHDSLLDESSLFATPNWLSLAMS
jgi:hypothetical protein